MEEPGRSRREALIIGEVLLIVAMVAAPLMLGSVRLWSLSIVAGLAGAAAIAASLGRARRLPWPVLAALGLALFTGLQALPVPRAVLAALSPHGLELLELSLGSVGSHSLSLDPAGSAREFGRLLAFALALAVASRLAADERAGRRLVHAVAALVVLQILFIVGHKVVATSSIYGVFTPFQYNAVLGTFSNANLLAGYLTLGIPLMLALAISARERGDAIAWTCAAAIAMVMVLLTGSRSGLLGMVTSLVVLGVLVRSRLREMRGPLLALGAVLLLGGAAAAALDRTRAEKLASLVHPGRIAGDIKIRAWLDIPALIHDYWATGIGRGAFETVFPAYKHVPEALTFTHAECAPLQLLADFGVLVGSAVMVAWVAAIILGARRPERDVDQRLLRQGVAAALAGISIHELGDFSLDVSAATGLTVAVLFGVLWPSPRAGASRASSSSGASSSGSSPSGVPDGSSSGATGGATPRREGRAQALWRRPDVRVSAAGLFVMLGAVGLSYAAHGEIAYDVAAVQEANVPGAKLEPLVREAIARHPGEPWFHFIAGLDRIRHRQPQAALRYLNRALLLDATAWRPHLAIAEALLQMGRVDQAVLEMRLAYLGSAFDDAVAVAMLSHHEFTDAGSPAVIDRFAGGNPAVLAAYAGYLDRVQRDDATALVAGQLLELRPEDSGAQRLLARADVRRRRFASALEHARKLPPGDTEAILLQVQSLDGLGRGAESDALLAGVERGAHDGDSAPLSPSTVMLLAERALQHNHAPAALAALERVVQDGLVPEELGRLHLLRANAFDKMGRLTEAINEAKAAARINPCEATWLAQGELYERAGLMREALLVYRGAVRSLSAPSQALRERRARLEQSLGAPTINGGGLDRRNPLDELNGTGGGAGTEEGGEGGEGEGAPVPHGETE